MTSPLNREELIKRIVMIKLTQVYPDDFDKTLRNQAASIAPVIDQYVQQVANEAKAEGIHEGIALAEAHTLPVIKAYRDVRYKSELSTAMKSLKSGFEQLHNLADEGVSLNATPVDNLKAQQEEA